MARNGIGALSRESGCKVETIRYYERIGLLPAPPRTAGGHRSYGAQDVARLAFIVRARELGFPIDDIRQLLMLSEDGVDCDEVRALTRNHVAAIRGRIADLQRLAAVLSAAADRCEGGNKAQCPVIDVLQARTPPG